MSGPGAQARRRAFAAHQARELVRTTSNRPNFSAKLLFAGELASKLHTRRQQLRKLEVLKHVSE